MICSAKSRSLSKASIFFSSLPNHLIMPWSTRHQRRYNLCKRLFFANFRQQIIQELLCDNSSVTSEEVDTSNLQHLCSFFSASDDEQVHWPCSQVFGKFLHCPGVCSRYEWLHLLHFRFRRSPSGFLLIRWRITGSFAPDSKDMVGSITLMPQSKTSCWCFFMCLGPTVQMQIAKGLLPASRFPMD
jgi:hypothetical protein